MTHEEFTEGFTKLSSAFNVSRPQDKARVYFEELESLPADVWKKTVFRLVRSFPKFPTIKDVLDVAEPFRQVTVQQTARGCKQCDGYGYARIGDTCFRARCVHGQSMVSQNVQIYPQSREEVRGVALNLGRKYVELYGCFPDWAKAEGIDIILDSEFPHARGQTLETVYQNRKPKPTRSLKTPKTPNAGLLPIGDILAEEIPL